MSGLGSRCSPRGGRAGLSSPGARLAHEGAGVVVPLGPVDHALVDPDLHADAAEGRGGLGEAVVDVGAQGVEGDAAVLVLLGARHVGASQAAGDADLAALGPALDGVRDGHLDRLAEGPAVLELPRDVLGDDLGVRIGLLDFLDLDLDLLGRDLLELGADALDVRSLDADEDAGASGMDHHRDALGMPDDLHLGDVGALALGYVDDPAAQREILVEGLRVVARVDVPTGLPVLVDA
jgi:hypothetical protein